MMFWLGTEELQKAKEESRNLDAELKKHRDKVLMLKEATKQQIDEMESRLEESNKQHVRDWDTVSEIGFAEIKQ